MRASEGATNGLLYMRARYYHPGLRRFVNPDPIGFEGGSNWYGYAGGNPLMANDPSGLAVRQVGWTIGHGLNRSAIFVGHHVLGKAWNSPNTAIGLAWGAVGLMAEAVQFPFTGDWDFKISFGNNAIQFENHPLMFGAITLGNTIAYSNELGTDSFANAYGRIVSTASHESGHTYQSELYGPLFLSLYLAAGGVSVNNPFEQAADDYALGVGTWNPFFKTKL